MKHFFLLGLLMLVLGGTCESNCAEVEAKPTRSARAIECLQSIKLSIDSASTFEGETRLNWLKAVHSQILVFHGWVHSHRHEIFPTRTHAQNDAVTRFVIGVVGVGNQMVDAFGVIQERGDQDLEAIGKEIEELIRQAKSF
jgi:hypothetical protein